PNVYGSIFRFEGQLSVFYAKEGPCYRCMFPTPPPPGLVPSCAEGGVLGILPGVVGTLQATEVIKVLLGVGTTLSGRLLRYDSLNMSFREFKLRKHPDTPPITELIDYEFFCGFSGEEQEVAVAADEPFARLTVRQIKDKLDAGWAPYVLDVRKPHEAEIVRLSFADRLQPHEDVAAIVDELPKDREILVHCKMGGRSAAAAEVLAARGFKVTNMEGGITAWAKEIDPSLPTY
ncbi:MAG: ThiF family adenylyltransferase, partial [Myxococcales bacterium]|nr:ThiF family adenylyltransferase [Myxococcales bacterium]